jgi:hypothetical protein
VCSECGNPLHVNEHTEGGTYCVDGTNLAQIDVTYNYALHYNAFWSQGIVGIYHRKASDVIPELEKAVEALGVECDDSYWRPTPGNAGYALSVLLSWAKQYPNGIFLGD